MRVIRKAQAGVVFALALATIAGCKSSSNPSGAHPDVTIEIVGINGSSSFSPNPSSATVGEKVAWHNADTTTHTATADGGQFNTGDIPPGATSSIITMSTAGTFAYHCTHHPSMTGTLTVTQAGSQGMGTGGGGYGTP